MKLQLTEFNDSLEAVLHLFLVFDVLILYYQEYAVLHTQ
jgi:hypothetical protein